MKTFALAFLALTLLTLSAAACPPAVGFSYGYAAPPPVAFALPPSIGFYVVPPPPAYYAPAVPLQFGVGYDVQSFGFSAGYAAPTAGFNSFGYGPPAFGGAGRVGGYREFNRFGANRLGFRFRRGF